MKKILLTTALISLAMPAYAGNYVYATGETQEVVPPAPPAPFVPISPFSGAYIGIHAGAAAMRKITEYSEDIYKTRDVTECWKWWQNDWNRQLDERYCNGGFPGMNQHYFDNARERVVGTEEYFDHTETWTEEEKETFLIYGAQAGYLWDWGSVLVGGEVSYSVYDSETFPITGVATVKARAGLDMGRVSPYAHVGYSWASGVADEGMSYGAGLDWALNSRIILGAEYTHYAFADYAHDAAVLRVSYSF
jgi:opacity protein-like surface antigen